MRRKHRIWVCLVMTMGIGAGQTRVSVKNQGRDFDLSDAARVRPFTVTTTLPATCQAGEMRFRTDVVPGHNLYGCAGNNLWVPMGGSSTVFDPGVRLDWSGPTQLTIGADCTLQSPCRFRFGSVVSTVATPGILTVSSGDGQVYVYITTGGQFGVAMTPASSLTLGCSGCVLESATNGFPLNSIPLWTWSATNGSWNSAGGTDQRTTLASGRRLVAGANSMVTESGDTLEISTTNYLPQGGVTSGPSLRLGGAVGASQTLLGLGDNLIAPAVGGTYLGMNTSAGFSGDLAQWQTGGTPRFRWGVNGDYFGYRSGATATWWGNAANATASSFRLAMGGTTATEKLMLGTGASANFLQANGLNRLGIGTAAPEPGTADVLIQDARPAVGDTQVQIRAGAAQARDLWQVLDLAGAGLATVTAQGALVLRPSGVRPACVAEQRGMLWFAAGAPGTADQLQVCQKTAANSYQWNP